MELDSLHVQVMVGKLDDDKLDAVSEEVSDMLDNLAATARDRVHEIARRHGAGTLRTVNDRLVSA